MTDLRQRVAASMPRVWAELGQLVAFRSVADARQWPVEECVHAGEWVAEAFRGEGFADARLVPTVEGGGAVVGSRTCTDPRAPTVLLHAHYDVRPPLDDTAWRTLPFTLTEVDGRWYGRGAADCKGNVLMHLTALRALGDDLPVNLALIVEGSEHQGTGGLRAVLADHADLLRAAAILVCDTGNLAVGRPAVVVAADETVNAVLTVEAPQPRPGTATPGGAAPNALAALVAMLAALSGERATPDRPGPPDGHGPAGAPHRSQRSRPGAPASQAVGVMGPEAAPVPTPVSSVAEAGTGWARPVVTVLGIDLPSVLGSAAAVVPRARALLHLRIPPGATPVQAQRALVAHLDRAAPWHLHVEIEIEAPVEPGTQGTDRPARRAMIAAMREAYGRAPRELVQGPSAPPCSAFAVTFPGAEILRIGVEEPQALVDAPNESVDPREIRDMALAEALFLRAFGRAGT
ncbi:M20/M25/M40 family metallo-hydrolase [Pseudonocardia sp.]|uniref:M20/M25/M40 family metallo-hydrolase n=1 Tax=Pseudonocardia sp. TaxID=60912 RepID=UPI003D0CA09D